MAELRLKGIQKKLGNTPILRGIDLHAREGELVVLVGASGCGKSTLLRVIAGLETPDEGSVHLGDKDVTNLPPKARDVAMVFQSYALYPHLSVRDNLSFGLKLRRTERKVMEERIAEVSEMLGLSELLDRLPKELSGGQRQRVAMGRAIARRPKLFLFDEPLSNLDAKLRNRVRVEIKALHHKLGTTMVYVTHDQLEAMTLADRLVVLDKGIVQQEGTPLEIFERPVNTFVAGFIGSPPMNLMEASTLPNMPSSKSGGKTVGVRPHELRLSKSPVDGPSFEARVVAVEPMGAETWVHGSFREEGALGEAQVSAVVTGNVDAAPGDALHWTCDESALHFFGEDGLRIA
ncbi:MAG: ABC-type sugar transport system ATPase subunit [Polyangiales bacterium]|jgi:ABC-type sugar transport system ATPase subunit